MATSAQWKDLAEKALIYIDEHPEDNEARSDLAFFYMMSNQPLLALRQYRILIQIDEADLQAQAGAIWALNNLKQYRISINTATTQLQKHPEHAPFHNLIGYALLKTNQFGSVRYHYHQALGLEPNLQALNQVSYEGLGWAYMQSDDFPKANKYFALAQALSTDSQAVYGFDQLCETKITSSVSYGIPLKDTESIVIEQNVQFSANRIKLGFEELRLNKKHERRSIALEAGRQFMGFALNFRTQYLDGKDELIYPAGVLQASIAPRFYTFKYAIEPILSYQTGWTRQQNMAALGAGASLDYNGYQLGFIHTRSAADSTWDQTQLTLQIPLYQNTVELSFTEGSNAWQTDAYGFFTDSGQALKRSYGFGLEIPLTESIELSQLNKYSRFEAEWMYSFFIRLGIKY